MGCKEDHTHVCCGYSGDLGLTAPSKFSDLVRALRALLDARNTGSGKIISKNRPDFNEGKGISKILIEPPLNF